MSRPITTMLAALVTTVAVAAVAVPEQSRRTAAASASPGSAPRPPTQSSSSARRISGIEVEFEVDQNRNGVPWRVTLRRNGSAGRVDDDQDARAERLVLAQPRRLRLGRQGSARRRREEPEWGDLHRIRIAVTPDSGSRREAPPGGGASSCAQRRLVEQRDVALVAEQLGRLVGRQPARVVDLVVERRARPTRPPSASSARACGRPFAVPVGPSTRAPARARSGAPSPPRPRAGRTPPRSRRARAFPSGTSSRRTPADGRGAPRARPLPVRGRRRRRRPGRVSADRPPSRLVEPLPRVGPGGPGAAIRSRSSCTSRPAANPLSGSVADSAHSRIRSCATTASWWSPRMSCSCFATATNFAPRLAELVRGEIRGVARPLDGDPGSMQRVVLGIVAELRERAAHPLRLAVEDLRQRLLLARERRLGCGFEPVEQREVAIALQRLDDVAVCVGAIGLEPREQARRAPRRRRRAPPPRRAAGRASRRGRAPARDGRRASRAPRGATRPTRDRRAGAPHGETPAAAGSRRGADAGPRDRRHGGCRDRGRAARGTRRRARSPSASPGGVSFVELRPRPACRQVERPVELRLELAGLVRTGLAQLLGEPAQSASRPRRSARPRPRGSVGRRAGPRAPRRCRRRSRRPGPGRPRGGCAGGRRARAARRGGTRAAGRRARPEGGRAGRRSSSSSRAAPRGSFSCHSPAPSSTRCRNVIPCRARRRSAVS